MEPEYSTYRPHIHILDNDSLLQILSHYRLDHENNWNLRYMWRNLAHVCRRWRHLVYDSTSHLDMYLLLTNNSPSLSTLSHLPPLPLVIDYSDRTEIVARKHEGHDTIQLGLQQHDHVRRVFLQAPSSSLRMWLEPINKPFPRLKDLSLLSTTVEETNLMLPETFQAPDLRRLTLHGIGLSTGLQWLSSTIALSTLSLTHIGASCYFPPRQLVTQLQGLPYLEELSIGFAIPIPLPSSEEELFPPLSPVRLPALRRLTYRGVDDYIDTLAALINTPHLEQLSLIFFLNLSFSLVNLTEFIHRTERFGCLVAQVIFNKDGASLYYEQQSIGKLSLRVNCEPFDWQIDSAIQVCNALGNLLSAVEELTIDLDEDWMPSDRENTLDSTMWHELLLPFVGVKKLHIGFLLTFELSQALDSAAGGLDLELLPELQKLEVRLEIDDAKKVFSAFIETRESVGRSVHLLALPIPHAELEVLSRYRKQATSLISIYRNFIQAEEQTIRSHNELRM
jgi:F-box-like